MISMVRKVLRLDPRRRALLAEAVVVHASMVVMIRIVPLRWVWRACERSARRGTFGGPTGSDVSGVTAGVAWAVSAVAAAMPAGSTCLTVALTADRMLKRRGLDSVVVFGVASDPSAPRFHAWVEC